MGKNNNWLYIGSFGLVIAAIATTAIIDRTKDEDIRAKAGITTTQEMRGVVSEINENEGTVTVTNLEAPGDTLLSKNQGVSWTVTAPSGFNVGSVSSGSRVKMKIIPSTFLISTHTATATEITPVR